MRIRNGSNSPRGIHNARGRAVIIPPGEVRDVDLDEGGVKWVRRSDAFEFVDGVKPDVSVLTLREQAEGLGIEVDGRWGDRRIAREIDAVRNAKRSAV